MKDASADYIEEEESKKHKPMELYHMWRDGGEDWYYTSHDSTITWSSNDYVPAVIGRGSVKYDAEFEVTKCNVTFGYVEDPVLEYIAQNPVEIIWIDVRRYYAEVSPEADATSVVFIGQIKNVSFQGNKATATCVGFEHYLNIRIPKFRYQVSCNNDLFDDFCVGTEPRRYDDGAVSYQYDPLNKDDYKTTATVSAVDSEGVVLTSTSFGSFGDGYLTRGKLYWGDYRRMIVDHTGNDITLRFRMPGFTAGQSVDVYAGCDCQLSTCIEKFHNQMNFFGHPWIPRDNPATWIS